MAQDNCLADIQITNQLPDRLRAGINIYQPIEIRDIPKLNRHIQHQLNTITETFRQELPSGYQFSRRLYRDFHIDPTKNRPSSEALWRRLKNKGNFPRVNPFVDLTNLLSLSFQICFGLYDLDKISGDIRLDLGTKSDQYRGIGKDVLHMEGKIILADHLGAFGNPSSDSSRTSVSGETSRILQILFFHRHDPESETLTQKAARTFSDFFQVGEIRSLYR